ncbi:hypothetical protein HII36_15300 [Nonomuraea sp. NN258]|uniref:hypothetical protein n=1 Tax=Nonomuraea antri TaxID=2730852 RepID=UPI0015689158|nr:hypothetical protein [Nonomuraea antri]NRQ33200.1 hypothetical protein [Nonomuraea antri]
MGFPEQSESSTDDSTPRRSRKERKEQQAAAAAATAGAAGPAGSEQDGAAGQQSRMWSPYDEGGSSRGPLWFAVGGVVVLALLVGGIVIMWKSGGADPSAASAARHSSAPLPSGPTGKYGYAVDRENDPEPLTVKELFAAKKFTVTGRSYEMTITSKDKKCTDGVLGDKLQKALKSGKCTQFIRASFRDKAGKVIGTVGVANLKTSGTAGKVAAAGSSKSYVKPLAGKDEVTKFLGSGSGGAKVWTHGHYAILVWFQNKDGSKPDKKGSKLLFQAVDDITKATVFKALEHRSVTGSPAV